MRIARLLLGLLALAAGALVLLESSRRLKAAAPGSVRISGASLDCAPAGLVGRLEDAAGDLADSVRGRPFRPDRCSHALATSERVLPVQAAAVIAMAAGLALAGPALLRR